MPVGAREDTWLKMVAWLATPRKPGFGYRRGWDEEVPNTPEIGDASKGGVVRVSTHIDPPMLGVSNTEGQQLYEKGLTRYQAIGKKELSLGKPYLCFLIRSLIFLLNGRSRYTQWSI
jgi:hypothetical protein